MKIVICASEIVPFAKTGGLADVVGALPAALRNSGAEVITVMPRYKGVQAAQTAEAYFIEEKKYFDRVGLYGDKEGDFPDNLERFSFYCKKTLELLKEIDFCPDIIHCHDWQTSLIPVYLKTIFAKDDFFKKTKTVLTIHNLGYQGLFPKEEFSLIGLDWKHFNLDEFEFYGKVNLLKAGIFYADIINTVSPTYAKEIQTEKLGFGLDQALLKRKNRVFGILNGLDYKIWNPKTDKLLAAEYSSDDLSGKEKNKLELQKISKFKLQNDIPLIGMVSRLVEAKGFDLIAEDIEKICKLNLQMVILATGDKKYEDIFKKFAAKYKNNLFLALRFDNELAHKIYAGSDIFLMPSHYEPCGLGQMISLKYGAIPVVNNTGGLADTVNNSNGFVLAQDTREGLIKGISEALSVFRDKEKWNRLTKNAMSVDFSWERSGQHYLELYAKA